MARGSVGTATLIEYVNTKGTKRKAKKHGYFCVRCRTGIEKGQWYCLTRQGTFRHFYPCPKENK